MCTRKKIAIDREKRSDRLNEPNPTEIINKNAQVFKGQFMCKSKSHLHVSTVYE